MAVQHGFDLGWRDVLAADPDEFLGPAGEQQAPVGAQDAEIAGGQPAVVVEHGRGLLRHRVVAAHHVPPANQDFALLPRFRVGTGDQVAHAHGHPGSGGMLPSTRRRSSSHHADCATLGDASDNP